MGESRVPDTGTQVEDYLRMGWLALGSPDRKTLDTPWFFDGGRWSLTRWEASTYTRTPSTIVLALETALAV